MVILQFLPLLLFASPLSVFKCFLCSITETIPLVTVDVHTPLTSGSSPNISSGTPNNAQSNLGRERAGSNNVVNNFTAALRCWHMVNSQEAIYRGK